MVFVYFTLYRPGCLIFNEMLNSNEILDWFRCITCIIVHIGINENAPVIYLIQYTYNNHEGYIASTNVKVELNSYIKISIIYVHVHTCFCWLTYVIRTKLTNAFHNVFSFMQLLQVTNDQVVLNCHNSTTGAEYMARRRHTAIIKIASVIMGHHALLSLFM